jgi:hypothetical protein
MSLNSTQKNINKCRTLVSEERIPALWPSISRVIGGQMTLSLRGFTLKKGRIDYKILSSEVKNLIQEHSSKLHETLSTIRGLQTKRYFPGA